MSKRHKYQAGETVYHDYSVCIGEILEVRDDPQGYDYFVRFLKRENDSVPVAKNWYQENVLTSSPPKPKRKGIELYELHRREHGPSYLRLQIHAS